ncbi:MAG: WYL domain-containing protein [Eubacteriales bacterium]
MAKGRDQKKKILCLLDILYEKTDETHVLNTAQLIEELGRYGIEAERKSIYTDIEALMQYGVDIICQRGKSSGYYIGSRDFELAELKLLVDAVQSSKFITEKKSKELIQKIEKLTNKYAAHHLHRQVYVTNRAKTINENIYYNVDEIYNAINMNKQIRFQYFEWNTKKEMQLRKNGDYYQISPWALVWDDENYYLIGFDADAHMIKHYRVDKMLKISVSNEGREGGELFKTFDPAQYSKKTFGMYGGVEEQIVLSCNTQMIGVILDRFGKDISVKPIDEETFEARVSVAISKPFFGWVTGLGGAVRIKKPEAVATQYQAYLEDILQEMRSL